MRPSLLEMTIEELTRTVEEMGHPAYRGGQLADWVYGRGVTDPAAMSNLPRDLAESIDILPSRIAARADSEDGTIKLLIELADGEHVETVLIPTAKRVTACLSTQAGCAMGCRFCASTIGGLRRDLTSGEMLAQILHLQQAGDQRVTNVVFMGMGEPLANYDATVRAVRAIVDPQRFGVSARRVTVSTLGLPGPIRRLAGEDLPITLAISLHAPNDVLRQQLIPAAGRTPLDKIIAAAETFYSSHNREITLEYLLLSGVNDSNVCADALAKIASRLRCNINLIRYNPVESLPFSRPSGVKAQAFAARLKRHGVNVHIRRSRGLDTAAACGQLRRREGEANAELQD